MPVSLALLYKNQRGAPILPDQYTPQRLHSFSRLGAKIQPALKNCNYYFSNLCKLLVFKIFNLWYRVAIPNHYPRPSLGSKLRLQNASTTPKQLIGKENALLWADNASDRSLRDHGTVVTLTFLNYE